MIYTPNDPELCIFCLATIIVFALHTRKAENLTYLEVVCNEFGDVSESVRVLFLTASTTKHPATSTKVHEYNDVYIERHKFETLCTTQSRIKFFKSVLLNSPTHILPSLPQVTGSRQAMFVTMVMTQRIEHDD